MGQPTGWASAENVIDLGELGDHRRSDHADRPGRSSRGLALVLVALLAIAGLVRDVAPGRLSTIFTLTAAHSDFDVTGGVLYLFDGPYAPNRIAAYQLSDGQRLWQTDTPVSGSYDSVYQAGGRTLLVPNPCVAAAPATTVALDTRTGREVWRRPGVPQQTVAGGRLVLLDRPGPAGDCGTAYPPIDAAPVPWDAVDAVTGTVVWTMQVPPLAQLSFDRSGRDGAQPRRSRRIGRHGHQP